MSIEIDIFTTTVHRAMTKQYSISEARNSLPALVHAVEDGTSVELTRRGRPVAILVSIADYDRLTRQRPDLWSAIERFRAETDLEELDVESILDGVEDRSPGREPEI